MAPYIHTFNNGILFLTFFPFGIVNGDFTRHAVDVAFAVDDEQRRRRLWRETKKRFVDVAANHRRHGPVKVSRKRKLVVESEKLDGVFVVRLRRGDDDDVEDVHAAAVVD